MAADEDVPDTRKQIRQEHFERAMEEVIAARSVLRQSLMEDEQTPEATLARMEERQGAQQAVIEQALQALRHPVTIAIALASLATILALLALLVEILRR